MSDGLAIATLGGLQITLDGAPLGALASRKAEALLVFLACAGRPQGRDVLAELLWDDLPAERARGNLSVLLTSLRQRLPGYLAIGRHSVALEPSGPFRLDVAELVGLAEPALAAAEAGGALPPAAARQLEQAVARYGGDFLHGFALRDGRGFEEWARGEQERLRNLAARALLALAQSALAAGDYPAGAAQARRLLQLEPLHEEGHHLLLLLLAHDGQRGPALAHYEELCRTLDLELGVAPAPRTTELYRQIWHGELTPPARPAPPSRPAARRGELRGAPFTATSFVGRERELAAVVERLADPGCRLLTLVGPGGSGKSRLALRAAAERAPALADGALFVPLAALSAAAQVAPAIAAALRYTFRGSAEPLAQVVGLLRERELLLLLDNAEHLPELAEIVAELLAATPRLQIVVTSRERLRLQAEWLVDLAGLDLPAEGAGAAELERSGAGLLFAQRARAARPDFTLQGAPPAAVAQICRLTEGLPLAIELAAALTWGRGCAEIADELSRSLGGLSVELRDLPGRHRSMRAVFDQSWALLSPGERAMLSQLAIFRGGFAAADAAAICAAEPGRPIAETLAGLAAKSLLRHADEGRFAAHELVRQLAAERLEPAAAAALAGRHAAYYLALAGRLAPALLGPDPQPAAQTLRRDRDNLRAAWGWAAERGAAALLSQGLDGLAQLYDLDGLFAEGLALFEAAAQGVADAALAGRLAAARAMFLLRLGRHEEARPLLEALIESAEARGDAAVAAEAGAHLAHALWRLGDLAAASERGRAAAELAGRAGLPRCEAAAERALGNVARQQGQAQTAEAHARRALALAQAAGDARDEGRALNVLGGLLEERGAYVESQERFGAALALGRALGDRWLEAVVLGNLGNLARDRGEHADADGFYRAALAIYEELGDRYSEGILRFSLGNSALDWGDDTAAEAAYAASLQLAGELGDRLGESLALMGLGNVARQRGAAGAEELARRAWELAAALESRPFEAVTAIALGHALLDLGRAAEGAALFARARALRAAIGETHRDVEALAGLARAALLSGDVAAAAAHAGALAERIAAGPLEGVSEPPLIYLICARALEAAGDGRASAMLAAGAALLRERAARIADPDRRAAYLAAVPAHRELLAAASSASKV